MHDASLYIGTVMHHRIQPKRHRFIYRLFTLLLDIDRLPEIDHRLRLFSVDRFNLLSFHNKDHGKRDGTPLRPWVEAKLRDAGIDTTPAYIHLLSMPRFLGYVFNPLSIYYCYDEQYSLTSILYEVKNTFGEQHPYVFPILSAPSAGGRFHHQCAKAFYVSPFIEADASYRFSLNDPGDQLDVRIAERNQDGPLLAAVLKGMSRPLTDWQVLIQAFKNPFVTHKVILSIHFEAFKLWMKGLKIQPR
jgi:DUF1365 family protein